MNPAAASPVRDGTRAPVVPDIVREHLEELGFLSLQRRKLLFADDVTPRQLARHDRRIEAHAAALQIARADGAALAKARLAEAENGWEIMACAWTWIETGDPPADDVHAAIEASGPDGHGGWREALRRLDSAAIARRFPLRSFDERAPLVAAALVDAFARRGALPPMLVAASASSPHPLVRRGLARHAAGFAARGADRRALDALREDPEPEVARAARWTSFLVDGLRGEKPADPPRADSSDPFWSLAGRMLQFPAKDARPTEEGVLAFWRRAALGGEDPLELRGEVPDGFFRGELADEALPGE